MLIRSHVRGVSLIILDSSKAKPSEELKLLSSKKTRRRGEKRVKMRESKRRKEKSDR